MAEGDVFRRGIVPGSPVGSSPPLTSQPTTDAASIGGAGVASGSEAWRTTQAGVEAVARATNPEARVTSLIVEAVVERDYVTVDVTVTDGDPMPND